MYIHEQTKVFTNTNTLIQKRQNGHKVAVLLKQKTMVGFVAVVVIVVCVQQEKQTYTHSHIESCGHVAPKE